MYRGASELDGDHRVQHAHHLFKGLEVGVLVGKDAEDAVVYAKADSCVDVLLRRLEPSVPLSLEQMSTHIDEDRSWALACLKM